MRVLLIVFLWSLCAVSAYAGGAELCYWDSSAGAWSSGKASFDTQGEVEIFVFFKGKWCPLVEVASGKMTLRHDSQLRKIAAAQCIKTCFMSMVVGSRVALLEPPSSGGLKRPPGPP